MFRDDISIFYQACVGRKNIKKTVKRVVEML